MFLYFALSCDIIHNIRTLKLKQLNGIQPPLIIHICAFSTATCHNVCREEEMHSWYINIMIWCIFP